MCSVIFDVILLWFRKSKKKKVKIVSQEDNTMNDAIHKSQVGLADRFEQVCVICFLFLSMRIKACLEYFPYWILIYSHANRFRFMFSHAIDTQISNLTLGTYGCFSEMKTNKMLNYEISPKQP